MAPWRLRVRWFRTGGVTVFAILSASGCALGPADEFGPQVTSSSTPLDNPMSQFREVLAPYGTWMNLPDVGWVWHPDPNVVGADFVPYTTGGRWVSSDWGWTFESDWDWGQAPFHYGRWFTEPSAGWVWWPDSEWAPAWVDWRWGDGLVGWQPLAPPGISTGLSWTFVGANDFVRPDVGTHRLPDSRVQELMRQTQPVGEHVVAREGYWNRGPEPKEVARVTGQEVPRAKPMTPPTGQPPRAQAASPEGVQAP
ncbi:hypothetical protein KH5H1_78560 [Corallococcus caeni]|uniref:DUF6600 domain-containing protein n=1 Tax=Corallococcus caeni TaxID=3082388 RepID=UPI002956928D|nr:hypothetical protein KH5H1_78560 [Corallococcus sp. KH5-1]